MLYTLYSACRGAAAPENKQCGSLTPLTYQTHAETHNHYCEQTRGSQQFLCTEITRICRSWAQCSAWQGKYMVNTSRSIRWDGPSVHNSAVPNVSIISKVGSWNIWESQADVSRPKPTPTTAPRSASLTKSATICVAARSVCVQRRPSFQVLPRYFGEILSMYTFSLFI